MLTSFVKSVLISLGLTAAADAEIHKNILGSETSNSGTTTLITLRRELEDIMKIVKSLKGSGLLIKYITQTINNEMKEHRCRSL